jgi:hypothetical protein
MGEGLRHIEWDGWGGLGGGDTTVYLVYDPANSLAQASSSRGKGKVRGIPCGVASIHRFADRWYEATFYADTDWDHCE